MRRRISRVLNIFRKQVVEIHKTRSARLYMEVYLLFSPISTEGFSRLLCYFQQLPLHSIFVFTNFNILRDRHDAEWGKQGGKIVLPKFHGGMIARPFCSGKAVDTFGRALFYQGVLPCVYPLVLHFLGRARPRFPLYIPFCAFSTARCCGLRSGCG